MRRQTVTATDSRPDNKDSDGSGDEDFLYYYYYYVDDDDTKSKWLYWDRHAENSSLQNYFRQRSYVIYVRLFAIKTA